MIISLTGTVTHHGRGYVIVEQAGVGYKVILPEPHEHTLSGEVCLYTHELIRDSDRDLFGFLSLEALELFWKLIQVSGVGPKSAQKIVFASSIETIHARILEGEVAFLKNVPGVGTKTAQKIILELRGVLSQDTVATSSDRDAVEALVGLGYVRRDAEQIIVSIEADSTEERIRLALKALAR
jgi:holliday junction DNA helicase RuvA